MTDHMSDRPPWVRLDDAAEVQHELDMVDAELSALWRVVFGNEPMPKRRRRALARLWGAATTVTWSHVRPRPPGLVLIDGGES